MSLEAAAIQAGGNLMSGITSALFANMNLEKAAELQRTNARYMAKKMPGFQREGLEKAGYNPMLAITNGQGGVGSPVSPVGATDLGIGDATSALGEELNRKEQEKEKKHQQENQDKIVNANVNNIKAQTAQTAMQTKILKEKNEWNNDPRNLLSKKGIVQMADNTAKYLNNKWNRFKHKVNNFLIYSGLKK